MSEKRILVQQASPSSVPVKRGRKVIKELTEEEKKQQINAEIDILKQVQASLPIQIEKLKSELVQAKQLGMMTITRLVEEEISDLAEDQMEVDENLKGLQESLSHFR